MYLTGKEIKDKALKIKLLLTDCDGVLTDGGIYYSARGEEMKRFSILDGMGVARLRKLVGVETGIITGENSDIVLRRAEKLRIKEYYPGVQDKLAKLNEILKDMNLAPDQVAYIGDDVNDLEIMKNVGLSACPADAISFILDTADVVLKSKGGYGAFRDFAEIIISIQLK
jgi:3-deoxy-D-manno-octulosonate 8-phosphate phosphatase (KDO 8-P phosphatase)